MISKTSKEKFVKSKSSEEKVQNIREIYEAVFAKSWAGMVWTIISLVTNSAGCLRNSYSFIQGWISDMGIDGPTFVPKSGYFLLIWVKVCPQKLAFS